MAVTAVSVALLAAMVALVALNVVMRYVLRDSLTWSSELARYLMVWSALLAAAVVAARGQHLAVDLLEWALPRRFDRWLRLVVGLLNMTFLAVMFISGFMLVVRTSGQVASSLEWLPISGVYAVIPASALLMFVGAIHAALRGPQNGTRG